MKNHRLPPSKIISIHISAVLLALTGCVQPERRTPLMPLSLQDAASIVNANIERIPGTLKASGNVDGKSPTEKGSLRSYHADADLIYLAPTNVRFDLKVLGTRQFLFGSNSNHYWFYNKEAQEFKCGQYGRVNAIDAELMVHPRDLIDALGLTPIPVEGAGRSAETSSDHHLDRVTSCVQRITDEHQKILFLVKDPLRNAKLQKEYWISRYEPRLVERVVFLDSKGTVTLTSDLADYRKVRGTNILLPHKMTMRWPENRAEMRFQVQKWTLHTQVGPHGPQFKTPPQCP